jgi:hypothetical protein
VAEPPATKQSVGAGCGGDAVCPPQDACAAGGCSPPAISPISLLGTDAGVDFAQPLHLTPPATIITGDSEALLGHWVPDPDKNCSVECLHLLIERDPGSGATIGHVYFVAVPVGATLGPIHFAPASDPGVGYPRELQPGQYNDARSEGVDEQRYRLFDGKVEGDRFTVWWSWLDLWSDWCALQTPQRVKVADETRYVCAPSVDDPSIDLGKRVLCTSADMSAACDGGPCVCAEDPSGDRSPLCSTTYCQCDASSCEANPWSEPRWLDLTRVGDRLEGVERNGLDGSPWRAVAFTKSGAP